MCSFSVLFLFFTVAERERAAQGQGGLVCRQDITLLGGRLQCVLFTVYTISTLRTDGYLRNRSSVASL